MTGRNSNWWPARQLQTLFYALRILDFIAAGLGPSWLVRSARFRLIYVGAGLAGALIGYLWGKAERVPGPHNLGARVKRQLIALALCFVGYIILGFTLEDWIPMLVVRSPGIYKSPTFIRYGAWIHAAVWGACFLILTRLLTLLARAASREQDR